MPKDLYGLLKREISLVERVDHDRFHIDMRNEDSEEMQQAARININKLAQCRKEIIVKMQEELKRRKSYEKNRESLSTTQSR